MVANCVEIKKIYHRISEMIYQKITVVTPSFNQGAFIEQTILSVIGQQYPNLEYIVIDGGSTDNTVDIIRKYEQYITHWVSEPDAGQSNAINKGFEIANGDILCWLNSDDYYLPGILFDINSKLTINKPELIFGNCIHLNEEQQTAHGSYFDPFKRWDINTGDYIAQPASFWTKTAFEITGALREDLHYGFDWEWYARANSAGVTFTPSANFYAVYRIHNGQKSDDNNVARFNELIKVDKQLNPAKFEFIDQYIAKHRANLVFWYGLTANRFANKVEYRLLKLFHPELLKRIDRVSLKKYLQSQPK